MSLDIRGKGLTHTYHWGYNALHKVRYAAYILCDGDKNFGEWMAFHDKDLYDFAYICQHNDFPNLCWHSDCDGLYSPRGITPKITYLEQYKNPDLFKGNIHGLYRELCYIKGSLLDGKYLKKLKEWDDESGWVKVFNDFFAIVEEAHSKNKSISFS